MEFLNNIWVWIGSAIGGVTLAGIIGAVVYGCLKGAFNRAIQKMNVEKVTEGVVNKSMERIKEVSFTQSIQPIVESELKKITEEANKYIEERIKQTEEEYAKIIAVLEKFYAYFDDSLVSDAKKKELKEAIESAKTKAPKATEVAVDKIIISEKAKEVFVAKEKPRKARIER